MITAVFTDNDDYARAYGLWQWDYGQELRIQGLHLPAAVEIHFALTETGGEAITRVGTTKDGITTVTIPDSMLEGNRATWTADKAYNIYAWVYLSDKSSGETIKRITMQVKSRPKPEAFDAPEDGEIFREAIEVVNDAAKRAEEAGDKAIAAGDEAKAAAAQTAKHLQDVQGLAEQVETNADTVAQDKQAVAGMLSQTQQAASDAALSAQAAKLSETAAAQAQTGAEAAEDTARQYAADTETDRQAVANDKQAVSQMREAVAADRQAVEQATAQFGQSAQDALTAIGQAQSTAVGAVKAEGNKQTTAVQEAGTQAVKDVTAAKTETVQAVTAEGDKQTKRVEDAAAGLAEGMVDLAPAIHSTASGSVITADDATEGRPFRGLRVFGKSTQVRTTGAQLFDANTCLKSQIEKGVVSINSDGKIVLNGVIDANNRAFTLTLQPGTYTLSADKPSTWHIIAPVDGLFNKKITVDVETTYNCYIASGTYNNTETTPMINVGLSALPWEPYTGGKPSPSPEHPQDIVDAGKDGSITVDVMGKNLFDISGDINIDIKGNKTDGANTVENDILTSNVDTSRKYSAGQKIFVTPGKKYSASAKILSIGTGKSARIDIVQLNPYKLIYSKSTGIGYLRGTFVSDSDEIVFSFGCDGGTGSKYTEIQLEESDAPTPYEPYRTPQSLTLSTPNGLPGVPVSKDGNYIDSNGQQWICDEIDLGRGKYIQRVAEKDIYESQNTWGGQGIWGNNDNYNTLGFYSYINGTNGEKNWERLPIYNGMCKYFCLIADAYLRSTIGFTMGDYIAVRVPRELLPDWDKNNPSAEPWVNWLKARKEAGNPVIVRYALKTPIERDLTPEEIATYKALHTNYPTTVISNDAGAHMEVAYVADTKNYIDAKIECTMAKLAQTQAALISQKVYGGGGLKVSDSCALPVVNFAMSGKTEQRKTSGKNLFDINSLKKYEVDNNDLKTSVDNDKIVLEGKGVTTTEVIFFCLNKTDDLLKLNPGKYTLSFKSNMPMGTAHKSKTVEAFAIIKKADGSSDYSSTGNKGWTTFDIAEGDMMYLRFDINNGTMTAEFYDIQLEYGSSVTAYEPYTGGQPSPSPDYPQSIEVADQPITVTIKGGTESQSITLTPPRPFTKWDKLEKVDGVWCWVYQSTHIPSYSNESVTTEYFSTTGELNAGAEVYCKADTSESIPLSPSEQAQLNALTMYAGTTEVSNNGGCTMDLTYTADTKTYIDNKLAAISAAMIGGT